MKKCTVVMERHSSRLELEASDVVVDDTYIILLDEHGEDHYKFLKEDIKEVFIESVRIQW